MHYAYNPLYVVDCQPGRLRLQPSPEREPCHRRMLTLESEAEPEIEVGPAPEPEPEPPRTALRSYSRPRPSVLISKKPDTQSRKRAATGVPTNERVGELDLVPARPRRRPGVAARSKRRRGRWGHSSGENHLDYSLISIIGVGHYKKTKQRCRFTVVTVENLGFVVGCLPKKMGVGGCRPY